MMLQYFLSQCGSVNVCVYFCRTYRLVSQHSLDGAQIGTTFKQSGGKRVAQRMGLDGLLDACLNGLLLNHDKYHGTRQMGAATV